MQKRNGEVGISRERIRYRRVCSAHIHVVVSASLLQRGSSNHRLAIPKAGLLQWHFEAKLQRSGQRNTAGRYEVVILCTYFEIYIYFFASFFLFVGLYSTPDDGDELSIYILYILAKRKPCEQSDHLLKHLGGKATSASMAE
jgi:hypothetical protein